MTSFTCPHQDPAKDRCLRLNRPCVPVQSGCVLCGKVALAAEEPPKRSRRQRCRGGDAAATLVTGPAAPG